MKKLLVCIFLLVTILCLTGCLSDTYQLVVIDEFGYMVKPLENHYKAGEDVDVHLALLSGPAVGININGEYIGQDSTTKHVDGHIVITFTMPNKDSILYTTMNGLILRDCGDGNHKWDEGREVEGGTGAYLMKYYCELCCESKEEIITINPPQGCPYEYSITEEGHSIKMLCDCCESPAVEEPHKDLDKNQICDECRYVFDTTGINGIYSLELIAGLFVLNDFKINFDEKFENASLWIQNDTLYFDSFRFASGKAGTVTLDTRTNLSEKYNFDDLNYVNEEDKELEMDLFSQELYYATNLAAYPERVQRHFLIKLNDQLYYIYTLFMLGTNGPSNIVYVFKLNK